MFKQFLPDRKADLIFIGLLFSYLFLFIRFNPNSFAIDDYMSYYHSASEFTSNETRDFFFGDGRWGNYLVALLLFDVLGVINSISVNYFFGLFFQIQLAYCCWLLAKFFKLDLSDKWLVIPFLLLAVHPYFIEIQTFKSATTVASFSCYLPIGIIGTILLFNAKNLVKGIGILLIVYALSVYQLIINVIAVIILLKGIEFLINKESGNIIVKTLSPFLYVLIGLISYLFINKLVLHFYDIPLTDRAAIETPINLIKRIIRLIALSPYNFLKDFSSILIPGFIALILNSIVFKNKLKKANALQKSVLYFGTLLGTILIAFMLTWYNTWFYHIAKFGKIVSSLSEHLQVFLIVSALFYFIQHLIGLKDYYLRTALVVFLIPSAYVATSGISFALAHLYLPYRVFTGSGFFIGILIALYYSKIKLNRLLKNSILSIAAIIVFSFTLSTNSVLFESSLVNQFDRNKANRIITSLEQIPNFKEKRIVIQPIGAPHEQTIHTKAGDLNESAFNRPWSSLGLLEYVSGYDFQEPTDEDRALAKEKSGANTPKWPSKESILIEKDLIIIFI